MKTCEHLWPLEDALLTRGIALRAIEPIGDDWRWHSCNCTFEASTVRPRLRLGAPVLYEEHDAGAAGSDAIFGCVACRCAIVGVHPRYAPPAARRLA